MIIIERLLFLTVQSKQQISNHEHQLEINNSRGRRLQIAAENLAEI